MWANGHRPLSVKTTLQHVNSQILPSEQRPLYYSAYSNTGMIKLRKLTYAGYVPLTGVMVRNTQHLGLKCQKNRPLCGMNMRICGTCWTDIGEVGYKTAGMDRSDSTYCSVVDCHKRGNEKSCYTAGAKFHGCLRNYQLLKGKRFVRFLLTVIYAAKNNSELHLNGPIRSVKNYAVPMTRAVVTSHVKL